MREDAQNPDPAARGPQTKMEVGRTRPSSLEALRRGNVFAATCPSRLVLRAMTSRWGVLVLVALLDGTQRFSELRRRIEGISERMLAQTLQELEGFGLVLRHAHPVVPPHVDYRLTPLGLEAAAQVRDLAFWVEGNLPALTPTAAAPSPEGVA